MKIPITPNIRMLMDEKNPTKILQGGSSSGKTWSILYRILIGCLSQWENETIDVVRDTMPALRISAMKDWEDILKKHGIYSKNMHNKSHHEYRIKSNLVRFYSSDNEDKVRGPRRDRTYFNEVLSMKKMDVEQIMMRTKKESWSDYNPSETFHWFYDEYADDKDNFFHKSTYKDNPFLEKEIIRKILKFKERDLNMWRIYGLGERGAPKSTIYPHWKYAVNRGGRDIKIEEFEGEELYGMDFGFNDPTTLVRIRYHPKGGIMVQELLYQTELTSENIVMKLEALVESGALKRDSTIIADSARPEIIRDIKQAGFNIHKTKKGKGSILRGINFIKQNSLFVTKDSVNLAKELRSYKWKTDSQEHVLDTPIDLNDHLMDAMRYGLEKKSRKVKTVGTGIVGRGPEE